ncbi:pyridoxamine 5'-phosphate oxidase family protein [Antrihabitans cavernicola]|uniref:Pyridoxamine 5'-phosphate oxidase family protein n=1 Tax=Antrihabitans cavernicola TaxID=2495913 RepID=A0A5A7S5F8_9NOCA|nr:pyridoxamine 5'-phosphate oxidase family protein [Spelaeibacter cavernicola]KAA0018402.1 pyridoxamine 5'-phosphate oxidase family protein [Spelaeibacter cavernicola]
MVNNHYHHLAFGPHTVARQQRRGSYTAYGSQTERPDDGPMRLDRREELLIASRDQFQIATVTESGWPYMQYRSGPKGFLQVLDDSRLGFADFRGNNQYVTTSNIDADGRVALFIVDYPTKQRLKLYGRAQVIDGDDDPELLDRLQRIGETRIAATCERSIVIDVEAFDWNCTRSIIPRYDREYLKDLSDVYQRKADEREAELNKRIAALEAEVEGLKAAE